jgi:hypothetical protein
LAKSVGDSGAPGLAFMAILPCDFLSTSRRQVSGSVKTVSRMLDGDPGHGDPEGDPGHMK